jgi:hypothetical protein
MTSGQFGSITWHAKVCLALVYGNTCSLCLSNETLHFYTNISGWGVSFSFFFIISADDTGFARCKQ